MTRTGTLLSFARPDQGWVVEKVVRASTDGPLEATSTTATLGHAFSKFGTYALPLASAAALFAPWTDERIRCVFSRGTRSQSQLSDVVWMLDGWAYTEEPADVAEVRMLNELLALKAPEGFVLDLPE